jgi:hypothetical protein
MVTKNATRANEVRDQAFTLIILSISRVAKGRARFAGACLREELAHEGVSVSHKRVARLMREAG